MRQFRFTILQFIHFLISLRLMINTLLILLTNYDQYTPYSSYKLRSTRPIQLIRYVRYIQSRDTLGDVLLKSCKYGWTVYFYFYFWLLSTITSVATSLTSSVVLLSCCLLSGVCCRTFFLFSVMHEIEMRSLALNDAFPLLRSYPLPPPPPPLFFFF